ncbi:MAG: Deoxyguanosinetriphosphate triphosphohydrolase-like protein [Marine Group II euryarchaeote MED-G33]|nr:MAG: Deoxyguanosinetriphosphate triphosphohydrolase-like protein [Marine Group II euryarchaeote MED-G33]
MVGHDRVVRDNVHRDIVLDDDISRLVDTRTFQRLRDVKQLATCHYVFPTATHTRFVHSLGAQHLAGVLLEHLEKVNPGRISPEDARLVRYAALLHDIGHPPFSHALENDRVFANYHHHEKWGRMILEDPDNDLRQVLIELVGEDGLERMFSILDGTCEFPVLHEIVSSQLDVDRLDYLMRDQINTGAKIGTFDVFRIFRSLRIGEDGHLTVTSSGVAEVESYLMMRYHMYHNVYFHKLNALTTAYVIRALVRARDLVLDGKMTVSVRMNRMLTDENLSVRDYLALTDSLIQAELTAFVTHDDHLLSKWATLLASRSGMHKSVRVRNLTEVAFWGAKGKVEQILTDAGYDPEEDMIVTRVSKEGYRPYTDGIHIEGGRDIIEVSTLVASITAPLNHILLFVPKECREPAEDAIRQAMAGE